MGLPHYPLDDTLACFLARTDGPSGEETPDGTGESGLLAGDDVGVGEFPRRESAMR
jgi:hypothetical protein